MNSNIINRKHNRRSIRLKNYDYSEEGAYFITICTYKKFCVFGKQRDTMIKLSLIGDIVNRCWNAIPDHFPHTELDSHVVMPNHLHGIIVMSNTSIGVEIKTGVQLNAPTIETLDKFRAISPAKGSLSVIIRTFKSAVTKTCRSSNIQNFKWQRNYYEHVIRNENELNRIREYIAYNPNQWQYDRENIERLQDKDYDKRWKNIESKIYG